MSDELSGMLPLHLLSPTIIFPLFLSCVHTHTHTKKEREPMETGTFNCGLSAAEWGPARRMKKP